ncbi:MAG: adenylate kinase [Prevotellaceae bacterium]|nr:adenylate kinase [Prevotellaceae bacterium]
MKKNLVIFGAPGSGKGTYSAEIAKRYGMAHISTGDVLREEMKKGTELGKTARGYIDEGRLIPDELMIDILANVYDGMADSTGVIFDGFPRTTRQAEALERMLAERGDVLGIVVELHVDEATLMERLLKRAEIEGRADDNEATIRRRFEVYHAQTEPVAAWFEDKGMRRVLTWKGAKEQMLADIYAEIEAAGVATPL